MFKKVALSILAVLVVAVVGVLLVASTRPSDFTVQRSASIRAPADRLLPMIADFRQWPAWSPWEKLDPNMKRTYSGAASGVGSVYEWSGSSEVGQGRMEVRDVVPASKVGIQLDFIKPFEGHNVTDFTLVPQGERTEVTWLMHGPAPFVSKLMGLFVDMDKMIGKDFETGLANLKAASEK